MSIRAEAMDDGKIEIVVSDPSAGLSFYYKSNLRQAMTFIGSELKRQYVATRRMNLPESKAQVFSGERVEK